MKQRRVFILMVAILSVSCSSTTKQLKADKAMLSDTGELTRAELETAATEIAGEISVKLVREKGKIAVLPLQNRTSELFPGEVFDSELRIHLSAAGFPAVIVADRERAMKEIAFSQTGLTESSIDASQMAVPDYFIETSVDENVFRSGGKRIVEQTITTEIRSVATQTLKLTAKRTFRKQPAAQGANDW